MNAAARALSPIQHHQENTTPPTWWILLKIPPTPPTWWILLKIPSRNVLQAHRRHHTTHVVDLAKDPSAHGIFSKIHHKEIRTGLVPPTFRTPDFFGFFFHFIGPNTKKYRLDKLLTPSYYLLSTNQMRTINSRFDNLSAHRSHS